MPPNGHIIGRKMMRSNVSITAEKKRHTLKNTVMALPDKLIIFLGRTFSGHNHDYLMLKQEFPPDLDWFTDLHVRVDLGYLGIKADYRGEQIDIPTRKPRKSQKHPNPQLSEEQKAAFLDSQFRAQHAHYQQYYPAADRLVTMHGGREVGRLYIDRWPSEHCIIDIAFLPEHRGKGRGRRGDRHL